MRKTRSQTQAENANLTNQQRKQETQRPQYTDAEFQEVRNMLMLFRVFELQRLLISLHIQPGGRKIDLQNRLLDLLKKDFKGVSAKIRAVYRTWSLEEDNLLTGKRPNSDTMYQQVPMQMTVQSDVRAAAALIGNNIVVPFAANVPQIPIHPDVRLKKLAFYDVLATLIQPSTLVPQTQQRTQEACFYFTLTPQQATDIASNRDIRNGSKAEYTIQVQLRFCLVETSCEQEDCFPSSVMVKVNNKPCPLPNPIPTNRPNVEPKRPPRPVNVTANIKLSPTVTNNITIQWNPDFSKAYCISVYLVRKLTSQHLLNRMKSKGVKPADYTRALIKEKLNEDADCEIATTMLRVSLICPLGKMRMSIPSRASTCSHLQCFDGSLFLQMNERKPTWNCPVCDKPAVYETLVIDGYFQEVLASPLLTCDDTEIQLHKDGSWSTLQSRSETQVVDTPKAKQKVEIISDDLEVITTEVEVTPNIQPPVSSTISPTVTKDVSAPASAVQNEPTSTTNNDMIDLTISDSEDEEAAKSKNSTVRTGNCLVAPPPPVAKVLPMTISANNNEKQRNDSKLAEHEIIVAGNVNEQSREVTTECSRDDAEGDDNDISVIHLDANTVSENLKEKKSREKLRKLWEKTKEQRKLVAELLEKDKKHKKNLSTSSSPNRKKSQLDNDKCTNVDLTDNVDNNKSTDNSIRFRLTTIRTDDDKNKSNVIKIERISNSDNKFHIHKTLHDKCKTKAKD